MANSKEGFWGLEGGPFEAILGVLCYHIWTDLPSYGPFSQSLYLYPPIARILENTLHIVFLKCLFVHNLKGYLLLEQKLRDKKSLFLRRVTLPPKLIISFSLK